jgi:hypothetical protein
MVRILNFLRCWVLLAALAAVAGLSGCASTYKLENQVQSFSQITTADKPLTYRFERGLSQQMDPAQQALEGLADPALHAAGFRRDDAAPNYSVQVSARTERTLSPYADPYWWPGGGWGWGVGVGWSRFGMGIGGPIPYDSYWFRREVGVVVRELASNKSVYETHAFSEGPYFENNIVLPAMFQAAMQGFPNPPPGPRRVDLEVSTKPTP